MASNVRVTIGLVLLLGMGVFIGRLMHDDK
jgi:hypothetical protein